MKVLFITKGRDDPATRYRAMPLLARLGSGGIDTNLCDESDGVGSKIKLLSLAKDAQLLFIQRKLFAPWFSRALKRRCNNIVYDFDDAIFCRSNGEASTTRMLKFQGMLAVSTLVFAGNEYLADQCAGVDKVVIPTSVDERRYEKRAKKKPGCVLVWIGSSSTKKYLEQHRDILEVLGGQFPDIVLKVIADFQFQLEHMEVINVPWSSQSEAIQLSSAHIGIAPMIDNPWTNGKCALKIVQYMAAGLPVISSRVGANKEVVIQGETGMFADSGEEWLKAVELLKDNPVEQSRMGSLGYARMIQHYSQRAVHESIMTNLISRKLV